MLVKYHYASGAVGYSGEGWWWHRFFNFPELPFVTKTITYNATKGHPFALLPIGNSVLNKVSLHNKGLDHWIREYYPNAKEGMTISIHGTDGEILYMIEILNNLRKVNGIELNYSCPNAINTNTEIPRTRKELYLKLNCTQDPFDYDLSNIKAIRVNSVPLSCCGLSGKLAQKRNWKFIKRYLKEGLNVAGCSFTSEEDIKRLIDFGCKEISIGSAIITNPRLIENILNIR